MNTDDGQDLARRLIALEEAAANQESQMQDLSDVLVKQWREIDRLGLLIQRMEARIGQLEGGRGDDGEVPFVP